MKNNVLSPHSNHRELPGGGRAGGSGEVFRRRLNAMLEKKSQRQSQVGEFEDLCRQSQGQSDVTERRHQRRFGELL